MELEVGMYVRGKYYQYRGKIGKIIKNYNNDLEIAYKDGILKTNVGSFIDDNYDINGKQYKASYNIIDMLEIGDYVNGSEVLGFENEYIEEDDKYVPFGVITKNCYLDNNKCWLTEKDIKSIVTKEQFKKIEYKVGE